MRGHRVAPRPAAKERPSRQAVPVVLDLRRAACAGHPQPQLWDRTVDGETKTQRAARKAQAAAICGSCPERAGCPSRIRLPAVRQRTRPTKPTRATMSCPECGDGFTPRDARQRYCATRRPRCRHVAELRERAAQRLAGGTSTPAALCQCGVALTAKQLRRRIKYHDPECRRLAVNERAAAYRDAHRPQALPPVRCAGPGCTVEFVPLNTRNRYHDSRCWDRALAERRARERAEQPPVLTATQVRCARCPAEFIPRDSRHRYHSPQCARAHANELRKARYQAALPPVPTVDRHAVLAVIHGRAPLTSLPHPHRWLPVRYLRQRDLSVRVIAQRVQAGPTTVQRILARAA